MISIKDRIFVSVGWWQHYFVDPTWISHTQKWGSKRSSIAQQNCFRLNHTASENYQLLRSCRKTSQHSMKIARFAKAKKGECCSICNESEDHTFYSNGIMKQSPCTLPLEEFSTYLKWRSILQGNNQSFIKLCGDFVVTRRNLMSQIQSLIFWLNFLPMYLICHLVLNLHSVFFIPITKS